MYFQVLIWNLYIFFGECIFKFLAQFLLDCFLIVKFWEFSLYILVAIFYQIHILVAKVFLSVAYLFILSTVSSEEKVLMLVNSNSLICSCLEYPFSSRSFIILGFTVSCLIYFNFYMQYEVWVHLFFSFGVCGY